MSGLEALGIACNVVQILSFAHETISFCKTVYAGQTPSEYDEEAVASLATLSARLQARYKDVKPQTSQERQLEYIARECNIAVRALEDEAKYLSFHRAEGNLKQTLLVVIKIMWRKNRLKRNEVRIRNCQNAMESHLLAEICSQSDAIELRQREDFEKLSGDLQYFISQYSAGYTEIADLVNTELASVNDHTTMESLRSEASVKKHVSAEVTTAEKAITAHVTSETNGIIERISRVAIESDTQASTKEQRDRLLQSLRYPAMNERKSDLADSHQDTFRWIFADDAHEGDDSSNSYGTSDTSITTTSDNSPIDDFPRDYQSNLEDVPWDSFSDWLRSDSKIYWISGKPGSGKSTLMKYLLENPRTKAGLEIWAASPVILSHFFWKPGSKIQNNIKGFLCSILHQCVSFSTLMLDSVLTTSQSLLLKESVTDWSMRELKEVCMDVLRCYPSPLCIFVDGLDEVCDEDGPISILNYVNDIQAIPNVKICVASRPEPLLHSTLSRHQHLRLQDLTENDMRAYSKAQIQPYLTTDGISREFESFAVNTLVYKAEGVFLWLHLAARSLIRGIENGDTQEEIGQRLYDLPNELSKLYSDMWARMNEDNKFYRESAARYFNLLIASRTLREGEKADFEPPSLFHIMAATESQVQHTFIDERAVMDPESLEMLCNKAQHAIQVRCAGLVEVAKFQPHYSRCVSPSDKPLVWDSSYEKLLPHGTLHVQFIHRTAYDFVVNTEDGQQIRSHDTSTLGSLYMKLIKAELAYAKIFQSNTSVNVHSIFHYSSQAISRCPQADIYKLLRIAWNWYDNRYYSFTYDPNIKIRPTFLAAAVVYPRLSGFIRSSIAESLNPDALVADILRNANYYRCITHIKNFPNTFNLIRELSRRRNSLCRKGICYTRARSQPFPFFTPLSRLIQAVYDFIDTRILEYPNQLVRLLHTFIQAGADLNERIPLLICLTRQGPRFCRVEEGEDFSGGFDLSEYRDNRGMLEYILLVSKAAVLTRVLLEQCYKHGNCSELPMLLKSEDLNDANHCPAASIKLITFCADNHPDPDYVRRYRPTAEEATGTLLALVMQALSGDASQTLYRGARKELTNIRREICNGSPEYEEVHKTPRAILAEEKCGYWFVDEEGNPIEKDIDSNDEPDQGLDGDGPYEDRFYDDSSEEEECGGDRIDEWIIEEPRRFSFIIGPAGRNAPMIMNRLQ